MKACPLPLCLSEAMIGYTNLSPDSDHARLPLHLHVISQSAPDIRKKLQKLQDRPQTPQCKLVKLAFKVHNDKEEEPKHKTQKR